MLTIYFIENTVETQIFWNIIQMYNEPTYWLKSCTHTYNTTKKAVACKSYYESS